MVVGITNCSTLNGNGSGHRTPERKPPSEVGREREKKNWNAFKRTGPFTYDSMAKARKKKKNILIFIFADFPAASRFGSPDQTADTCVIKLSNLSIDRVVVIVVVGGVHCRAGGAVRGWLTGGTRADQSGGSVLKHGLGVKSFLEC